MQDQIVDYLIDECGKNPFMAQTLAADIMKYDDICSEFIGWLDSREFPEEGVTIDGYNARKIAEMAPFMNSVGVYNFLVTLRDDPESAMKAIADGFPRG